MQVLHRGLRPVAEGSWQQLQKQAMDVLRNRRWALVEKKYGAGLTEAEHEELNWLADYGWRHRWEINR